MSLRRRPIFKTKQGLMKLQDAEIENSMMRKQLAFNVYLQFSMVEDYDEYVRTQNVTKNTVRKNTKSHGTSSSVILRMTFMDDNSLLTS